MSTSTLTPTAQSIEQVSAEIDRIFAAQQANVTYLRNTTARERITKLKKLRSTIEANLEELHEALHKDFRKSPAEVNLAEVFPIFGSIKHTCAKLRRWMKPKRVGTPLNIIGSSSKVYYESKGVALIISPWNYPFNLTFDPLVYAIAAGCAAILKPSEMTPHTSAFITKLVKATFPENEVAVFEGDAAVAQALLAKPFDHIFFTGSPALGKVVMRAAAEHLTSVTLELGGKSPVIVDKDTNINDAADKITYGKFLNCGQTCIAPDYILVHQEVKDQLVVAIEERINRFAKGEAGNDTIETTPDYARIVNQRHFQRIKSLLDDATAKGGKVRTGGQVIAEENFIAPTLIEQVSEDMKLMQEEIFGPLLPIKTFNTLKEATDYVATKPKPLALYFFGNRKDSREFVLKNTTAGGTSINETLLHITNPDLPFGGVNNSGIGKTHGFYGFTAFSNERAVLHQRVGLTSIKMIYPPYTPRVKQFVKLLMRT
jgi:aldehyde dehydrogenase (NAD+)